MASRKRKQCPPRRLDESKRKLQVWDMTDLIKSNRARLDEESTLPALGSLENENLKGSVKKRKNNRSRWRNEEVDDKETELKVQTYLPQYWYGIIGNFKVSFRRDIDLTKRNGFFNDFDYNDESGRIYSKEAIEIKVTLDHLDSVIDTELGHGCHPHASTSHDRTLPESLQKLSLKGNTFIDEGNLEAVAYLQQKGLLILVLSSENSIFDEEWTLSVCLCEGALTKLTFASQDTAMRKIDKMIQRLMCWFYNSNDDVNNEGNNGRDGNQDYDCLYENIKKIREQNKAEIVLSNNEKRHQSSGSSNSGVSPDINDTISYSSNHGETIEIGNDNSKAELSSCPKDSSEGVDTNEPECSQSSTILYHKSKHPLQHPKLLPTLRRYQCRAVQWMVDKEMATGAVPDVIHPLWKEYCTLDGKVIYYNKYNGRLTREKFIDPPLPTGGILADEMGLGKTVEVLACVLNNPMKTDTQGAVVTVDGMGRASVQRNSSLDGNEKELTDDTESRTMIRETVWNQCSPEEIVDKGHDRLLQCGTLNTAQKKPTTESYGHDTLTQHQLTKVFEQNMPSDVMKEDIKSDSLLVGVPGHAPNIDMKFQQQSTVIQGMEAMERESNPLACRILQNTDCKITTGDGVLRQDKADSIIKEDRHDNSTNFKPTEGRATHSCGIIDGSSVKTEEKDYSKISLIQNKDTKIHNSEHYKSKEIMYMDQSSFGTSDSYSNAAQSGPNSHAYFSLSKEKRNASSTDSPAMEIYKRTTAADYVVQTSEPNVTSTKLTDHGLASDKKSNLIDGGNRRPSMELTNERLKNPAIGKVTTPCNKKINCQCICGSNEASLNDSLLECGACHVMMHSQCMGHFGSRAEDSFGFFCPSCATLRPPVPSGATLIISPATISSQWVEEIQRHTAPGAVRLLVYEGVLKQGFIQPEVLGDHDIVLTTYATLRADFYHVGVNKGSAVRSRRHKRRYIALPSPLTMVKFWRVCLDEAQMVETTTARAAEMALNLQCVHRWCVTGTPIQKELEDLYGLLLFLGFYPYCQRIWWNKLLLLPYMAGHCKPMENALAQVLWRTAKKDVLHEIQLPPQTEHVIPLKFSPVELHFYQRQHEECSSMARRMLSRWSESETKLSSIDKNTVHAMLTPLLRLRQACCHPQAVRGGFLSVQKSTLTMDQLLESLIARTKLECEEAHRQLLFAINGLAGIEIIKKQWPEAVERYRDAMRSWTEHEDKFRTDALQKLHTLHNLIELLSADHPGCSHTLRDDEIKSEVQSLKEAYMAKSAAAVQTALDNLASAEEDVNDLKSKVNFQSPWWVHAIRRTQESRHSEELLNRIREELSGTGAEGGGLLDRVTDLRGLLYVLASKLDTVESTHSNLVASLKPLCPHPTPEMVRSSAECCLRAKPGQMHHSTRCRFCEVDDVFTEYESRLFGHQGMKGLGDQDLEEHSSLDWHRHGNTGGLRAETEAEKALKAVFAFIRAQRLEPHLHQEARHHLMFIAERRKEFKFLRAAWFALRERVSSLDELDMCTTRMRLALPGETVSEDEKHVIFEGQVEPQRMKFVSDRIVAKTELRKKLGQLLYLSNLAKTQASHSGENPDPCPVCTRQLGIEWSVFSCGHCYCCDCVWVLLRQAGIGPRNRDVHVKCPLCRVPTLAREISYVTTSSGNHHGNHRIPVKGSHSTKVEAVVRALLGIRAEDNSAKCLVFSTWQDVLDVIAKALAENDVYFRHITTSRKLPEDLHAFKVDPDISVLLLPLQSGSNGLNIIEATHVLLVEPALNPAHELQALGRVHRIGQTKPTHVYRFIIQGTVESRMYTLLKGKACSNVRPGTRDTENASLTIGDLTSLFTPANQQDQLPGFPGQSE
ncbi:E3 ubiquitin-protein ligase SHPRH isoform X2 [Nematostella vectensis]|uniref:E3 ubiquitin-protein ligase SHPRH isoform X2 n=1 Tax=Nematostella vectensis TaxID=45351 RepID=UPI0020778067|nr:E3 ubiquitin-protein ligase SHPRH isoform X2 [Nematostella vectensis]